MFIYLSVVCQSIYVYMYILCICIYLSFYLHDLSSGNNEFLPQLEFLNPRQEVAHCRHQESHFFKLKDVFFSSSSGSGSKGPKNLLFYLKKSNKSTIQLCFLSSSRAEEPANFQRLRLLTFFPSGSAPAPTPAPQPWGKPYNNKKYF